MLRDIKTEVFYPYPPERVWQVLTNRQALAAWLMNNDFEPRVGHKFRFQTQPLSGFEEVIDCEVIELDEPRRLSYTWRDRLMHQPSIVTWTLRSVDGGTQLRLEHRRLETAVAKLSKPMHFSNPWQGQFMYESSKFTQTLEPMPRSNLLQSESIRYEKTVRGIPCSYLSEAWSYKLNRCLPQILANEFC